MFDVGMGEVGLIAVIALLVLGPERLPGAARTAGALLRKARQGWQSVKSEIERELAAEELKRNLKETAAAADPTADVRDAMQSVKDSVQAAVDPHVADPAPIEAAPVDPADPQAAPSTPHAVNQTHERS